MVRSAGFGAARLCGAAAVFFLTLVMAPATLATQSEQGASLSLPIHYETLDNGLRVVLSPDESVPTVTVGVYFGIGFRSEPQGRTGYAHLFEHLYFAGSQRRQGESFDAIISQVGGYSAAYTRHDFTRYVSSVPSNGLETVLWAEADRMAAPVLTQQQLDVHRNTVRNEIFLNIENQPYQGWPMIDLPMTAFENWHNSHNFYGDFADLDAATLADALAFFEQYYTPNNAVLVVAGDFQLEETAALIRDWFGPIPRGPALPPLDVSEDYPTAERSRSITYPQATQPGIAVGYHMPERGSPEYYAMAVIDSILVSGSDGRFQRVADDNGYGGGVAGGIHVLGNAYNYNGPMLWEFNLIHDDSLDSQQVLAALEAEIARLRDEPVDAGEIRRARAKRLVEFYLSVDNASMRDGIIDLLASFALFDDDPTRINRIEDGFDQVTPELIQATAREYLAPERRTVVFAVPGSAATENAE